MADHKGWHSRGYLPHFDSPGKIQSIVIHLADSMPIAAVKRWEEDLRSMPPSDASIEKYRRVEEYLDAGYGSCILRNPDAALAVENALHFFDGERYRLFAWCVMPNHLHALVQPFEGTLLGEMIKSWKVNTTMVINKLCSRSGQLWFDDYHDRYIRDDNHFADAKHYIEMNPVVAGLCRAPEEWTFGSARLRLDGSGT